MIYDNEPRSRKKKGQCIYPKSAANKKMKSEIVTYLSLSWMSGVPTEKHITASIPWPRFISPVQTPPGVSVSMRGTILGKAESS